MRTLLFTATLILLGYSCEKDTPTEDSPPAFEGLELEGRWELTEAKRNNRTTQILDGLYFVFGPDNAFETNLGGEESAGKYIYDDRAEIVTSEVSMPATYLIRELSDGEMVLETKLEGSKFQFLLSRAEEEVES
ncbi:MAG: hypothetical protein AAF741_17310 [Bacteroidota bacterium]